MSKAQEDLEERIESAIASWISEWDSVTLADLLGVLQAVAINRHTPLDDDNDEQWKRSQ